MEFSKSALVVVDINRIHFDVDMQILPVSKEDAERVIKNVSEVVIPAFRKHNRPIIFITTAHRHNPVTGFPMCLNNPLWKYQYEKKSVTGVGHKRKLVGIPGSKAVEIMPQMDVQPTDYVVTKQRYSPFIATDLELAVRCMGIDTFFLVGGNTNNCVLSTAFESYNRDIRVVLLEDCCASMNGQKYHEFAIEQIRASLGWISTSDKVEGLLSGTQSLD